MFMFVLIFVLTDISSEISAAINDLAPSEPLLHLLPLNMQKPSIHAAHGNIMRKKGHLLVLLQN
jgi:hypothetical protein